MLSFLTSLKSLYLGQNQIKILSDSIGTIKSLEQIRRLDPVIALKPEMASLNMLLLAYSMLLPVGRPLAKRVICEYQEDNRAEVLVIRQYTTRKSGYHTKERQCVDILTNALQAARLVQ